MAFRLLKSIVPGPFFTKPLLLLPILFVLWVPAVFMEHAHHKEHEATLQRRFHPTDPTQDFAADLGKSFIDFALLLFTDALP